MFERIKRWYQQGLWTKKQVMHAVIKNTISESQYETITSEKYLS